ncbi:YceI family protein [Aureibaculum sp. 2210JD6-5]|uniref:YceI family protein n=1 Tax=Aureibaculum sp. 2210JD6-5 TaxID=3103957 RepID=UPI002AAC8CB3|nr:YceI family protein [Aureibaculum sp. 2210JD6-5]MDY7396602.1 YceI family protein [Aureibaculum sp. 2210JD6-5]
MKNQILKGAAILFLGLAMVACKDAKNKTEASAAEEVAETTSEAATYTADVEGSTIAWKGAKLTGTHDGTIKISDGSFSVEDGKLVGGNFIIDMNSIAVLDLEDPKKNADLTGHLKSDDFFDVENHANGVFTITGVEEKDGKNIVKGNLTVKDIKKNIEFPAVVSISDTGVTLKSEPFTIDRTEWDVKFKSGKFTDLAKDKLIDDNIELQVEVKGTK